MELGLYTFADMLPDNRSGRAVNARQRMKDLMEEIQLADQLGLDVFGLGEHHRPEYAVSSPAVVLGAAAAITKKIKLSSAVTVLRSDGTPASALRAGTLGIPMALAIIGGTPERFVPFIDLYRETAKDSGHNEAPVGINSHVYVAETSQQAADEFYPAYSAMMNHIGKERGWSLMGRQDFEAMRSPRGSRIVGSPQQVIDKILFEHGLFKHQRFLAQISMGNMPHKKILRAIELFGTKVVPEIRKAVCTPLPAPLNSEI